MAYENLLIERDGGVLVVTINRPEKLNALNTKTVTELGQVMDEAASDSAVKAIVLRTRTRADVIVRMMILNA